MYYIFICFFFNLIKAETIQSQSIKCFIYLNENECNNCKNNKDNCICVWNKNSCIINQIIFEQLYSNQRENDTKIYCGFSSNLILNNNKILNITPSLVNNKYGKENSNLYCIYKLKLEESKIPYNIYLSIISNQSIPIEISYKTLMSNSKKDFYKQSNGNYELIFSEINIFIFLIYIKMIGQYNEVPFIIEINSEINNEIDFLSFLLLKFFIPFFIIIVLIIIIIFFYYIIKEFLKKNPECVIKNIFKKDEYNYVKGVFGNTCTICLEDFLYYDIILITPCLHIFHEKCLEKWLENKKNILNLKCPNCNAILYPYKNLNSERINLNN